MCVCNWNTVCLYLAQLQLCTPEPSNLASRYILFWKRQHRHIRRKIGKSTEQYTHYNQKDKNKGILKIKLLNRLWNFYLITSHAGNKNQRTIAANNNVGASNV